MLITIERQASANGWTLGRLAVDGRFECYTCEDVVRAPGVKVYGKTAIPAGRYRVIVSDSPRFKRRLPLLVGVQGFEGIRIHPGNTAEDTEGCILPGLGHTADRVTQSAIAFAQLMSKIDAAQASSEQVWIEISQRQAEPVVLQGAAREQVATASQPATPSAHQEPGQG